MAVRKMKVPHAGQEIEIDLPDSVMTAEEVAEQYVPKAAHNSEMAKLRKQAQGRRTPDELLEDEDFKGRAVEAWGIKPGKTAADVEQARKEWETRVLRPVSEENTKLKQERESLRRGRLQARLVTAAAPYIKPHLLKASEGNDSRFINMTQNDFAWNEEHNDFFVRKGDSYAYSAKGGEGAPPYKTPEEYVSDFVGNRDNADFLVPQTQQGAGLHGGGNRNTPGVIDGNDPLAIGRNLEKIAKGEIVVQ